MAIAFNYNPCSKESQLTRTRIKPSQRQLGEISQRVRNEVKARSSGFCEVRKLCKGTWANHMAHITGRKQLNHRTTAEDLLHSCVSCHRWLDTTTDGIEFKRMLLEGSK